MKKILFLLAGVLLFSVSYAQKGNVNKAVTLLDKGEIAEAKAEIDVAVTVDKNIDKSKTWMTRGRIYKEIALSEDAAVQGLAENPIDDAMEAFNKAKAMESEGSTNYNLIDFYIEDFWTKYLNGGGEDYSNEDYDAAYEKFSKAAEIKPTDSLTLFYAGVAAQQAGKNEESLDAYYRLIENGYANEDVYSTVIYMERAENQNDEKALEVLQKAKEAYPDNVDFMREEINILITLDKADEAIQRIQNTIEREPDNASLYLRLASLYDNIGIESQTNGETEKAKEAYEKAQANYEKTLELEPNNFVANFNLGVIWVNNAKEFYDKVNTMDLKTYQKEGAKVAAEGDRLLNKSVPYLEAAHAEKPEDCDVLNALQQVYTQLKKTDKAEEVLNKKDALKCEE